jgi:nucleoside 2-deoxyribosyltransferase
MKKAYLICPVRKLTEEEKNIINNAILEIRKEYNLYIPYEQKQDCSEIEICERYKKAVNEAEMIFVWWNPLSEGSVFDFGMSYAMGKPIKVINTIKRTEHKSYSNFLDDIRIK